MYIDKQHCSQTDFTNGRLITTNQVRKCSERFSTITSELCWIKIENCIQVLQSWDPIFEDQKNLNSLSSGYHAPEDVKKDLMNVEVIRTKLQERFINDRIKTKKVWFYYPIKKKVKNIFYEHIKNFIKNKKGTSWERHIQQRLSSSWVCWRGHQSQWVVIFFAVIRCIVIIFSG